jgi:hypothetical protein
MSQPDYPSDEEIATAANIIQRLPRGYLPYSLFIAVASRVVTPTLELAILQKNNDGIQILLTKRPDDDLHWPGQWHVPGTVIRSTDQEDSFNSCFERILNEELSDLVVTTQPQRVSIEFWELERGREIDQLFYAELDNHQNLPENIRFFSVEDLPANLMRHHSEVIAKIVKKYKEETE